MDVKSISNKGIKIITVRARAKEIHYFFHFLFFMLRTTYQPLLVRHRDFVPHIALMLSPSMVKANLFGFILYIQKVLFISLDLQ